MFVGPSVVNVVYEQFGKLSDILFFVLFFVCIVVVCFVDRFIIQYMHFFQLDYELESFVVMRFPIHTKLSILKHNDENQQLK
jgi:hypothetical protein